MKSTLYPYTKVAAIKIVRQYYDMTYKEATAWVEEHQNEPNYCKNLLIDMEKYNEETAFDTKCEEVMNMPLGEVKKLIEKYEPYDKTLGEIARDLICEEDEANDRGTNA